MNTLYTGHAQAARDRGNNLSPRRQHLGAALLSHLSPCALALNEKNCQQLANRIDCTSADVLRAADDLWAAGGITMRMLGGTAYISKGVDHAR